MEVVAIGVRRYTICHVLQSDVLFSFPSDPMPGACNTEFALDIDPNVYVRYNLYETIITFAPANVGYDR